MTAFRVWDGRAVHLYCSGGRKRPHAPREIAVVAPYQGAKPEDLKLNRWLISALLGDRAEPSHEAPAFKNELDYLSGRPHGQAGQPREEWTETNWSQIRIEQGKNGPVWHFPACPTCARRSGRYGIRIPEADLKALIDAVAGEPDRHAGMADVSYWPM